MLAAEHAQLQVAVREELRRREAEKLKASLHAFGQKFWKVIEPARPFKDNWHLHVLCDHLEALYRGEFQNLLVNVPPGTSKSTFTSVFFPAWAWAHRADHRVFGASYAEPLAIRDAMLCRRIILSKEYQELFPHVRIQSGVDQKTNYALTGSGWRMATSVGGRGTGEHPDIKIIDDPHNVKQSESDVERERALNWFDGTVSSRGLIHDSMQIVIMQRLHQNDLTGHIMASEGYADGDWAHVVIPMYAEPKRPQPKQKIKWEDPRKQEAELLWPEVFTPAKVARLAKTLGEYRAAGQLQQRPAPIGGGILQTKHFQLWPAKDPLPDFDFIIQSYDTAFTDQTANDPTACSTYGFFMRGLTRNVLIVDCWTDWMKFPQLKTKMMDDWLQQYGGRTTDNGKADPLHPARRPDMLLLEDKGSGISLRQELQRANLPVKAYNPGGASKTARAEAASAVLEADIVWVLESKKEPGKPVTWVRPLLEQCESFPNGDHDDLVDTLTQALNYSHHANLLELEVIPDEEDPDVDYVARHRGNPYG